MTTEQARSVPLFKGASRRQLRRLAPLADRLEVPAGETLTTQGDYAREFFLIEDGTARVVKDGTPVATLGPGDFFGETGLLEGPYRTASVTAVTPMRLLVLAQREFSSMLSLAPEVGARVRARSDARAQRPIPSGG